MIVDKVNVNSPRVLNFEITEEIRCTGNQLIPDTVYISNPIIHHM
jgi:hypothetical protein